MKKAYTRIFGFLAFVLCIAPGQSTDLYKVNEESSYQQRYDVTEKIVQNHTSSHAITKDTQIVFMGAAQGREVHALKEIILKNHNVTPKITIIEPDAEELALGKQKGYMTESDTLFNDIAENIYQTRQRSADIVIWILYVAAYDDSTTKSSAEAIKALLKSDGVFYAHSDTNMLEHLIRMNKTTNLFDAKLIDSENGNWGDIDNGPNGENMSQRIYALKNKQ
jgi:hypothetical protein